jgi:ankyrin repeat protein
MTDITSLSDSVWAGDLAGVEAVIRAGVDVNATDGFRQPPLHLAIEQQEIEIVARLIAAGAQVKRDRGKGWTPLAHAIDIESDAACQARLPLDQVPTVLTELLLDAGAIPTDVALEVAREYGNYKALALLTRAGSR